MRKNKFTNQEIDFIKPFLKNFVKHPMQLNKLNESDSEFYKIKANERILTITQDIISDEITWGLYNDPYTWGWMSAVVSLSDLSAAGAVPQGLLIGTHWEEKLHVNKIAKFYAGFNAALKKHSVHLLGGDQSRGKETVLSSTGIGFQSKHPIFRNNVQPGDLIYAVGNFGWGPLLALATLFDWPNKKIIEKKFRPHVKAFTDKQKKFIKAAIDVSDGLAATFCVWKKINNVSFDIAWPKDFFISSVKRTCIRFEISELLLFFAEHGDYQNLVAVSAKNKTDFEREFPNSFLIAKAKSEKEQDTLFSEKMFVPINFVWNAKKSSLTDYRKIFRELQRRAHETKNFSHGFNGGIRV